MIKNDAKMNSKIKNDTKMHHDTKMHQQKADHIDKKVRFIRKNKKINVGINIALIIK